MKKIIIILCGLLCFVLAGCEENGATEGRPAIPQPESYIASVPVKSEELVVKAVTPTNYTPIVTSAKNESGNNIAIDGTPRIILVQNGNVVNSPELEGETELQRLSSTPELQLVRYWKRISEIERYPGGTTTSEARFHSEGSSSTESFSFTETLGVSSTVSGGIGFADVSATVSAEFSSTQEFESTFSTETSVEHTVTIAPVAGVNIIFCTWQLFEEFRLVNSEKNADGEYEAFTDPSYEFAPGSSMIFATDEIRNMTYKYNS
jgi:hypothetical protein